MPGSTLPAVCRAATPPLSASGRTGGLASLAAAAAALALALSGCDQARPIEVAPGTGGDPSAIACNTCHTGPGATPGAPFRDADGSTTSAAAGAHTAHLAGAGGFAAPLACEACHLVPEGGTAHAGGGAAQVALGVLAGAGGATARWDPATATCTTYCHGATLPGGADPRPAWTSGSPRSCGSCHGAPPPAPHPSTGACSACHPGTVRADGTIDLAAGKHLNGQLDLGGGGAGCASCHGAPPAAPHAQSTACGTCHTGYTNVSANPATHLDGIVQAVSGHPAGWSARTQHGYAANADLASCRACHGADLAGGAVGVSCNSCHGGTAWQTSCTFCHGDPNRAQHPAAPPVGTQGETAASARAVGAHERHLAGGPLSNPVACAECHALPSSIAHVDGTARVAFGALARTGSLSPAFDRATLGCAATWCHGGGLRNGTRTTPVWTAGSSQTSCGSCHGLPPSTGSHGDHSGRACSDCHGAGYSRTAGTVNRPTHVDGAVQTGNRITRFDRASRTCTNTCHGGETW
jgi:predicted CxxxxCH...CXXCH cytochrome family protein